MKVVFILVLVPMYDVSEYDVSTYQCTVLFIVSPIHISMYWRVYVYACMYVSVKVYVSMYQNYYQ
jgi:hypothetical protein